MPRVARRSDSRRRIGGTPGPFTLFAGPCVLEDDELNVAVARGVQAAADRAGFPAVFKASFDKANRSRLGSHRGPGLSAGLARLRTVRAETGLPRRDRYSRADSGRGGSRSGGRAPGSRLSLPADGVAFGGRENGKGGQREEGAVDVPVRDGRRRGEGASRRRPPCHGHGEGHIVRLWRPRRGHAQLCPYPGGCGSPRDLRRDALGPAARRRSRGVGPAGDPNTSHRSSGPRLRRVATDSLSRCTPIRRRHPRTAATCSRSRSSPGSWTPWRRSAPPLPQGLSPSREPRTGFRGQRPRAFAWSYSMWMG